MEKGQKSSSFGPLKRRQSPPTDPRLRRGLPKTEPGLDSNHNVNDEPRDPRRKIDKQVKKEPVVKIEVDDRKRSDRRIRDSSRENRARSPNRRRHETPPRRHETPPRRHETPPRRSPVRHRYEDRDRSPHSPRRSPSRRRDSPPRSSRQSSYQHDDRDRSPLPTRAQVKQELGLTREMYELINSDEFWEWNDEQHVERECPVCKVTMTGYEPWAAHLIGRKHRNAMKKYGIPIPKPRTKAEEEYEEELKDLPDAQKPIPEKTSTGIQYRCPICDIPVNDLGVYKSHIEGAKHKKRVNALGDTAVGIDSETCPVCRLTLKMPCSGCVALKQECEVHIGRCKHKVHKCCLTMPLLNGNCPLCPNEFKVVEIEYYEEQMLPPPSDMDPNGDVVFVPIKKESY